MRFGKATESSSFQIGLDNGNEAPRKHLLDDFNNVSLCNRFILEHTIKDIELLFNNPRYRKNKKFNSSSICSVCYKKYKEVN